MKEYGLLTRTEKIEELLKALRRGFEGMDPRTFWPAAAGQVEPYFSDYFALDWLRKYRLDKEKFRQALIQLYPNKLRSLFYHMLVPGLKVLRKHAIAKSEPPTTEETIDICTFILDVIREVSSGDVFCRDGNYRYWSMRRCELEMEKEGWQVPKTGEDRKFVGSILRIDGEQMVWSVQTDNYRTSSSMLHGLYSTSEGKLLVHEFFDLNSEVWGIKSPVPAVRVLLLYDKNCPVEFNFDFANHYIINIPGPYVYLTKYKIDFPKGFDRKFDPSPKNVDKLFNKIASGQLAQVNGMSDGEKLRKMIELGYYQYREFWKSYKESWKPPDQVWRRVKLSGMRYWIQGRPNPTGAEPVDRILKLFDPRSGYLG